MIVKTCGICHQQMKPAATEEQAARTLGLHNRNVHGQKGMSGRERYYVYKKGMTLDQARATIAAREGKAAANGAPEAEHKPKRLSTNVEPVGLNQCPICHSRFYVAKGEV